MVIPRQLITTLCRATSITLIGLLSSIGASLEFTFRHSLISLNFSSPALANNPPPARPKFRYVPPNRRPPKSTQATGSRGCIQSNQSQPVTLTLLVPKDHDGLTVSGHPTFSWHVSAPVPMMFALTERGVVKPIIEQQIQPQAAGIVQIKTPQDSPELLSGREYRWSVTLICNSERPSANPFVQTWIKRVPTTPQLEQQITTATSDQERASIYAQAGLWYDALEAISKAHSVNPGDRSILDKRFELLEQVGLTQVTAQEQ